MSSAVSQPSILIIEERPLSKMTLIRALSAGRALLYVARLSTLGLERMWPATGPPKRGGVSPGVSLCEGLGRYGVLLLFCMGTRERFSWSIKGEEGREFALARSWPSMRRERRLSRREVGGCCMRVVERMARSRGDEAGGAFIWALPSSVARESCKAGQQLAVSVSVVCR